MGDATSCSVPSHFENIDESAEGNQAEDCEKLLSPAAMFQEIPLSLEAGKMVQASRDACAKIISGKDDRLIVVVGPCSIHDPEQALEYARQLKANLSLFPDLVILMRSYFEKPRTTVGWKGLINDPDLDGTFHITKGLFTARKLLKDLTDVGLPLAVELLDTYSLQYLGDFVSWGGIGARTTESQPHRELASGRPHPVGFKNGTDGSISVAIEAMKSASSSHAFVGMNNDGFASIVRSEGNPHVHVILRGGKHGANYSQAHVSESINLISKQMSHRHPSIMIDCSHGNSEKNHHNQPKVAHDICKQLKAGNPFISGVMLESNIHEGRQDLPSRGPAGLKYGVSITDGCIDFQTTLSVLKNLQDAVLHRRESLQTLSDENELLDSCNSLSLGLA